MALAFFKTISEGGEDGFPLRLIMGMIRVGMGGDIFVEGEGDGEFAAAEVGLVEGLAFAGTAFEHCEVFAGGFVDGDFCAVALDAGVEDVDAGEEVGVDEAGEKNALEES